MKKQKLFVTTVLALVLAFILGFTACNPQNPDDKDSSSGGETTSSTTSSGTESTGNQDSEDIEPTEITVNYNTNYNPTKFDKTSVSYEAKRITDGFILVANTLKLTNGKVCVVYSLEVDLSKVTIAAGTKDNVTDLSLLQKEVPAKQAEAYEAATGKTVYASLNADFFGTYPVNAFVKDGIVVKDSHNDNNNYDYTNDASDVPASAPMLFGVNGTKAQVAPIISYTGDVTTSAIKKSLVKAKLSQKIGAENGMTSYNVLREQDSDSKSIVFNTNKVTKTCKAGDYALKVNLGGGLNHMRVMQKIDCATDTKFTPDQSYGYVFVGKTSSAYTEFSKLEQKYIKYYVSSPDRLWNGYTTILGCRQSLVENGQVPSTVALENSNGAQRSDIPRSAVGVKEDGTVVIFAVESMYYYSRNQEGDTHGMSLPELADFMAYYGIKNGANFDGGGSTQLIVNENGTKTVKVRSADTASTELYNTRKVINSVLVVSK